MTALCVLSGPGRIDIVDGQVRYEVAHSLVEHGDVVVRDSDAKFMVFEGRHGNRYAFYRLPHSLLGTIAILAADATGPKRETRRQFFFTLLGAPAAGLMAVLYGIWFARHGFTSLQSIGWALAGVFCTPVWFYSTSTFDDVFGATGVVLALVFAGHQSTKHRYLSALIAGMLAALLFHIKQPLALFVLPLWVGTCLPRPDPDGGATIGRRWTAAIHPYVTRPMVIQTFLLLACLAIGVVLHIGYAHYKFPQGVAEIYKVIEAKYGPVWSRNPLEAFVTLLASPGASAVLFSPTILLSIAGLFAWPPRERLLTTSTAIACLGFLTFVCSLTIFKGDPCWGPRYLTPVFAALWLYTPAARKFVSPLMTGLLLAAGCLVQLLGLSVDPQRLHIEIKLPNTYYHDPRWVYFDPRLNRLLHRVREIRDMITSPAPAIRYSFAKLPTYATPEIKMGDAEMVIRDYQIYRWFRPWWLSMPFLPADERPVSLAWTVSISVVTVALGALLISADIAFCRRFRK